jgi:hypothetical protein
MQEWRQLRSAGVLEGLNDELFVSPPQTVQWGCGHGPFFFDRLSAPCLGQIGLEGQRRALSVPKFVQTGHDVPGVAQLPHTRAADSVRTRPPRQVGPGPGPTAERKQKCPECIPNNARRREPKRVNPNSRTFFSACF